MSDLAVITTVFNPSNYQAHQLNYIQFHENMTKQGVPVYTVEVLFKGQESFIPNTFPNVYRYYTDTVLWHKERALMVAYSKVPKKYKKIAWVDADIIYLDDDWHNKASEILETKHFIQGYNYGKILNIKLEPQWQVESVFHQYVRTKDTQSLNQGHAGFAWCATREFLDTVGLYDYGIIGSGDTVMAFGALGIECKDYTKRFNQHFKQAIHAYSQKIYDFVKGDIGCVPSNIKHLPHGLIPARQHGTRHLCVKDLNPYTDITKDKNGLWQWNHNNENAKQMFVKFFNARNDDYLLKKRSQDELDQP